MKRFFHIFKKRKTQVKSKLGSEGGAWSSETHDDIYGINFNDGLAHFILEKFKPSSILDFGCGKGHYIDFYRDNQVKVAHGIEPVISDSQKCIFNIDITADYDKSLLSDKYDVVQTIEVLEHIKREDHPIVFDFLVQYAARYICFSAARPGQEGHGHIACRDEEDWRQELTSRGWVFDKELTDQARKACNVVNINHRRNVQIFRKHS